MKKLDELTLKELREMYPGIKANSREKFLKKVDELHEGEVAHETITEVDQFKDDRKKLMEELIEIKEVRSSFLIIVPDATDRDDLMYMLRFGFESYRAEFDKELKLLVRDRMHEIHLNGKVYIKISCKKMAPHWQKKQRFNEIRVLS